MADTPQTVMKDVETKMSGAIDALGREFATVRTGRASAGLLDGIRVDYYGTPTPVNQMASVSVPDAKTLVIQPWEASQLKAIEKAIIASDLGLTLINDGKIRPLAVSAAKRVAALPNVPTLAEAGLPDQEADTMQAVLVPAGTPRPIVDLLYREIKAIVALPDVKERFETLGLDPIANTPAEFAAFIAAQTERVGKIVRTVGVKAE